MHLLRTETRTLDEAAQAVDLGQSPAELVFLSFTDSDLAAVAAAWETAPGLPTLRVASLAQLKHPYSVDLYVETVASRARFVLVRLLGGLDYWRYGVDELAAAARRLGFHLAVVPGDHREDPRLDEASTLPAEDLHRLWAWFHEGGPDNMASALAFLSTCIGRDRPWHEPAPLPSMQAVASFARPAPAGGPAALIVFYRSLLSAADTAPIAGLADALAARGFGVRAAAVSSLKDPAAADGLASLIAAMAPDVILNTTAFSGRSDGGPGVLDGADCPVFQVILAGSRREDWEGSGRGLGAADLAMNVVLPEVDGRIVTRPASFKAETRRTEALEFTRLAHRPDPGRIDAIADLAAAWARLRRLPRSDRKVALVLSDYPAKGGRTGYAVGLDTPASVHAIAADLAAAGYDVDPASFDSAAARPAQDEAEGSAAARPARHEACDEAWGRSPSLSLILSRGPQGRESKDAPTLPASRYRELFAALPPGFRREVEATWGPPPATDLAFDVLRAGKLLVALQPDRGRAEDRKAGYHDLNAPPCHRYIAFYLWLRQIEAIDAMVHLGTHGTLEWLPGKAVALGADCAPEAVLGPVPVVYPFIVNNPGEAAQARRRIAAVTVGHLTPPLVAAGSHGAAAEVEALFDEYAQAQELDPRRARLLADAILSRAAETGLAGDAGVTLAGDPQEALQQLDGWICDLKEMRIGDGLHVFGRSPPPEVCATSLALLGEGAPLPAGTAEVFAACPAAETDGLLAALDGRFVQPGPAGAPNRGRLDVLPTGRNLFGVDPRAVPTRTAWEIGRRTAEEVVTRYAQDHGDWPRRIVVDLWGSATMRTGGDDLAQALALLGVRPVWDNASTRVSGFEILPGAVTGRPRVDVALRISGLFRDVFPGAVALFDDAVRAVAALDEPDDENPLAAAARAAAQPEPARIFGAAPGSYGLGLGDRLATGDWATRQDLGEAYLAASGHAYGRDRDGDAAGDAFRTVVARADAFVHVQDMEGQDVLDSDAFAEHEGGFAAAAELLGAAPALYHADTTRPGRTRVRTTAEEVARVLRGRAANPRWIEGQMRHGHRGAAEIAETVDNLVAWGALAGVVADHHFELMFAATCGNDRVRSFLRDANPDAARAIARRFDEALARGLWQTRSNSARALLAEMQEVTR